MKSDSTSTTPTPTEETPLQAKASKEPPLDGGGDTDMQEMQAAGASSAPLAFINMLKSMLGLGLFTMPFLTAKGGLVLASVVLCLFALMNIECVRLITMCAAHENRRAGTTDLGTWKHLASAAFGRPGVAVTVVTLIGSQLGVCTSYVDQLATTFETQGHADRLYVLPILWISLSVVAMLIKPGLRAFAYVSAAGMAALLYDAILLFYYSSSRGPPAAALKMWDWSGLPAFLGPAVFAFECAPVALSIYSSMGHIEPTEFLRVSSMAYAVGFLLVVSVAVVGYAGFGPDVTRVVLFSFPHNPMGLSAQWVINAVLFLSFNLQLIPVFQLVEETALPWMRAQLDKGNLGPHTWQLFVTKFVIRSSVVGAVVLLAAAIPDVETMVGVSGAIFMTMTVAILPPMFYLKLKPDGGDAWLTAFAIFILPVGLAIMGVGLYGQIVLNMTR